jgi:hypothetical protein
MRTDILDSDTALQILDVAPTYNVEGIIPPLKHRVWKELM